MPQLDKFPILFQFKSFGIIFLLLYGFFLLVILPIIHISLRLRKINTLFLLFSVILIESEIYRLSLNIFLITKNIFNKFIFLNELLFNILNKKIKLNEYK